MAEPRYGWDAAALRWRDRVTGRWVSKADVRALLEAEVDGWVEEVTGLTNRMLQGDVTVEVWEAEMRAMLKTAHCQQAMLGAGGRAQMGAAEWGRVGGILRQQYAYLRQFKQELTAGEFPQAALGRLLARARMYANAARREFYEAQQTVAARAGFNQKRRVLSAAEHCPDCVEQANLGWVSISDPRVTGVADGSTQCLTNCKCRIEYRRVDNG